MGPLLRAGTPVGLLRRRRVRWGSRSTTRSSRQPTTTPPSPRRSRPAVARGAAALDPTAEPTDTQGHRVGAALAHMLGLDPAEAGARLR